MRGKRLAALVAVVGVGAFAASVTGADALGARLDGPACLDSAMKFDATCKAVAASVELAASADAIVVSVTADAAWSGGPIAVEMALPSPTVDAESGEDDDLGEGYATWSTRSGVVVSRCQFDPTTRPMKKGATAECALPRLGIADGAHTMWVTGFVGQVPAVGNGFGTVPAERGVVAIATPRSVEFTVKGDEVAVDKPSQTDPDNPATQVVSEADPDIDEAATSDDADGGSTPAVPIVIGAGAIAAVGALIWRSRKPPEAENAADEGS